MLLCQEIYESRHHEILLFQFYARPSEAYAYAELVNLGRAYDNKRKTLRPTLK